jgi:hypothetical protein
MFVYQQQRFMFMGKYPIWRIISTESFVTVSVSRKSAAESG